MLSTRREIKRDMEPNQRPNTAYQQSQDFSFVLQDKHTETVILMLLWELLWVGGGGGGAAGAK